MRAERSWSHDEVSDHLCECGCGLYTRLIRTPDRGRGRFAGQPFRYVVGHGSAGPGTDRALALVDPNPEGLCMCGCGKPVAMRNSRVHNKFLAGHQLRKSAVDWLEDESGCWLWQRKVTVKGYGIASFAGGSAVMAHRGVYEQMVGPIPDGWHLHHKCGVKACVNPQHLEPISPADHRRLHSIRASAACSSCGFEVVVKKAWRESPLPTCACGGGFAWL